MITLALAIVCRALLLDMHAVIRFYIIVLIDAVFLAVFCPTGIRRRIALQGQFALQILVLLSYLRLCLIFLPLTQRRRGLLGVLS